MEITLSPVLGVHGFKPGYDQLNLSSKSQFLRDKLKLIRQSGMSSPEMVHQIESHLNAIIQESDPIGQWNNDAESLCRGKTLHSPLYEFVHILFEAVPEF